MTFDATFLLTVYASKKFILRRNGKKSLRVANTQPRIIVCDQIYLMNWTCFSMCVALQTVN